MDNGDFIVLAAVSPVFLVRFAGFTGCTGRVPPSPVTVKDRGTEADIASSFSPNGSDAMGTEGNQQT